jgi:hypothetical protein
VQVYAIRIQEGEYFQKHFEAESYDEDKLSGKYLWINLEEVLGEINPRLPIINNSEVSKLNPESIQKLREMVETVK